jgi:hypothetical protein
VIEPVADCHSEVQIFDVFNIPLRASLEIVFVGFDSGFELYDPFFEASLLLNMAFFPNSDGTDQGCCDPTEHDHVNVSFYSKGCDDRVGGTKSFKRGILQL